MGYLWEYPKVLCPEECRYRSKIAPFCGYCLPKIMKELGLRKEKEEDKNGNRQEEGSHSVQDQ